MPKNRGVTLPNTPKRGAVLLLFVMFAFPIIWFAGTLAVDVTHILIAQRQAAALAEAGAVAGATSWDNSGTVRLDVAKATSVALETVTLSKQYGAAAQVKLTNTTVSVSNSPTSPTVEVTVSYNVDNLVFLPVVDRLLNTRNVQGSVTRAANVCVPGANTHTYSGICERP